MSAIESAAPLWAQEDFDNSGLIVGHPDSETSAALLCVDVTEEVMDEAERVGAGMVVSHHPIIFNPLRRITGDNCTERIVERAIRNGIAIYACHTNLDSMPDGMSFRLSQIMGIENPAILSPTKNPDVEIGLGMIGELAEDMAADNFLRMTKERLNLSVLRHSDICKARVRRIAVCSGSGASLIETAAAAGADVYMAADFKYNNFIDADKRLIIADIGHFESEYCAINLLYDIISKKLPNFALHKSVNSRNPVNYLV